MTHYAMTDLEYAIELIKIGSLYRTYNGCGNICHNEGFADAISISTGSRPLEP
jgi:hypothetical protein